MSPWDNPEKLDAAFEEGLRSLGGIVYYFQQLDDELRAIVAFLVNHEENDIARTVACEMSFKQLLHMASTLPGHYYVVDRKRFDSEWRKHLTNAAKAEEVRNSLVHSTFGVSFDDNPVLVRNKISAKFGRGFKEIAEALGPDVMLEYRRRISGVFLELSDFFGKEFPGWRTREWTPKWDQR